MSSLKEEALTYEPERSVKNISDLEKVDIKTEVHTAHEKNKEGEAYSFKYIEVNGNVYRVPLIVLGQMKGILQKMPHVEYVTVVKSGTGKMSTTYQTMPYQ